MSLFKSMVYSHLYLLKLTYSRKTVRLGEYDTETNPDCVGTEEDKDCNEPPFDTTPESMKTTFLLFVNF